jgi:hypothetical protein
MSQLMKILLYSVLSYYIIGEGISQRRRMRRTNNARRAGKRELKCGWVSVRLVGFEVGYVVKKACAMKRAEENIRRLRKNVIFAREIDKTGGKGYNKTHKDGKG